MSQDPAQVPNVHENAVTGLDHDPVQGAEISSHDPVEVVDHPHNTSDDTAGEPAEDAGHIGGEQGQEPTGSPESDAETQPGTSPQGEAPEAPSSETGGAHTAE